MTLSNNLHLGEAAVKYVKNLGIKASNKVGDRIAAAGGIENVIAAGGNDYTAMVGINIVRIMSRAENNIRLVARHAEQNLYGNCSEQAAIAFVFLYDKKLRPLDVVTFSSSGYDHVWLVIGLSQNADMTNLRSWGREAVWVDPWQGDGMVFAVDDLVKGKVRNLSAIYKCHTVSLIESGMPVSLLRTV